MRATNAELKKVTPANLQGAHLGISDFNLYSEKRVSGSVYQDIALKFEDAKPQYPNFRDVTSDDKQIISEYTDKYPPYSDFVFSNLIHWGSHREKSQYTFLNGNMVIKTLDNHGEKHIFSVLGTQKIDDTLTELLTLTNELNYVPEEVITSIRNTEKFNIIEDRASFDYIFDLKMIADLTDSALKSRRKEISRFTKKYSEIVIKEIKVFDDKIKEEFLELFGNWWKSKKTEDLSKSIEAEFHSIKNFFDHLHLHDTIAFGAYLNDKLVGFSINEVVNSSTILKSFAKAYKEYPGLSSFIFRESSAFLQKNGFNIVNNEVDMGIEGLRQRKLEWKPIYLLKKYTVTLKP